MMMKTMNTKFITAFSLMALSVCTSLSVNAAQSNGDLSIFAPPSDGGNPTILFMIETSTFMSEKDSDPKWLYHNEDVNNDPYHNIQYKRFYTYNLNGPKYYSRISRLKDTIFYLMNTPGALPEDVRIGVGRYQATPTGSGTKTDYATTNLLSNSGGLFIPANYIDGDPARCKPENGPELDATIPSNKCGMYSEQRRLIKKMVSELCKTSTGCTGESPMAWAYAEAGAYFMRTKTAPVVESEVRTDMLLDSSYIYTLESVRLRGRNSINTNDATGISLGKQWQVCPKDKQVLVDYYTDAAAANHNYRLDCKEEDWVTISQNDLGNYRFGNDKPLEWNSAAANRPHGIAGEHPGWGLPARLHFTQDISVTTIRNARRPSGTPYWNYFKDELKKPDIAIPSHDAIAGSFTGSGIRNSPIEMRDGNSYKYKDVGVSECSGKVISDGQGNDREVGPKNGIIFFTSGFNRSATAPLPTNVNSKYNSKANSAENVMNMSFSPFESVKINTTAAGGDINCNSGLPTSGAGNPINNNWGCIGGYAKRLNSKNNPEGIKVKTGVFIFSKPGEFLTQIGKKDGVPIYNCATKDVPASVLNACRLGSEEYGGGGYIQTSQPTADDANRDLSNLIKNMKLTADSSIKVTPMDAPTIPADPFYPNALQKSAYLPLVYPDITKTKTQWQGNMRKYKVSSNGIVDKDGNNPYIVSGPSILANTTLDFWSLASSPYASTEQAGGVFERRPYPVSGSTVNIRPVFIEDINTSITSSGTSGLISLKPNSDADLKNKINSITATNISSPTTNIDDFRGRLLNFLGFNITNYNSNSTDNASILQTATSIPDRSYAGVMHSKPLVISYKVTKDTNDEVVEKESYVVFGATDNALHVVDDATGIEKMVFIPRAPLAGNGYKALSPSGTFSGVNHGIDAPWESDVNYQVSFNAATAKNTLKAESVKIYGGLRLGGSRYYGLDITKLTEPKLLFNIGASSTKFIRMAHTWAKPVKATIKWGYQRKKVLIVPGGYDRAFDKNSALRRAEKNVGTRGNAIYIIDADNGKPLMSFGRNLATSNTTSYVQARGYHYNNQELHYSVVGAPKILDRDADGLVDHIYFADLAGQVFRIDLNNGAREQQNTSMKHFVRVANFMDAFGSNQAGPRFYETPVVTVHKQDNKRFAVVSLASGDRSNPGFKNSEKHDDIDPAYTPYNNKLFAVIDKDVARKDLFTINESNLHTKDITLDSMTNSPNQNKVVQMMSTKVLSNADRSKRIDGWYYDLNRYGAANSSGALANAEDGKHLKAYGGLAAIDNDLYVSVYNFHDRSTNDRCSATVKGKTEANVYCLPFGYCTENGVSKGNVQRFLVGRGISPVTFGALDDKGLNRTVITQNPANSKTALEPTGKSLANSYGFGYYLRPTRWFDLTHQKK